MKDTIFKIPQCVVVVAISVLLSGCVTTVQTGGGYSYRYGYVYNPYVYPAYYYPGYYGGVTGVSIGVGGYYPGYYNYNHYRYYNNYYRYNNRYYGGWHR